MSDRFHTAAQAVVARRKHMEEVQANIELSLVKDQSLPDMLVTAPIVIQFLGKIKFLAFSDHALRMKLKAPQDGFMYLRYPNLTSAMLQIVDQATEAFECASKNMRCIRLKSTVMFGRESYMEDVLRALQSPEKAKKQLPTSLQKFHDEMLKCVDYASQIEVEFDKVVKCSKEAVEATSEGLSNVAEAKKQIKSDTSKAKTDKNKQTNILQSSEQRVKEAEDEYKEKKKLFKKQGKKSEMSAYALGLARDLTGRTFDIINATVELARATPRVLLGQDLPDASRNDTSSQEQRQEELDPALLQAEQMQQQITTMQDLLQGMSEEPSSVDTSDLEACLGQLNDLLSSLDGPGSRSQNVDKAKTFLRTAIDIGEKLQALKEETCPKNKTTERWRKNLATAAAQATRLLSFSACQPGYGIGFSRDLNTDLPNANQPGYDKVVRERQRKLTILKQVMDERRAELLNTRNMQLEAQNKIIELVSRLEELDHQGATAEQTRAVLVKSMEAMMAMQSEVKKMCTFFNSLSGLIREVGKEHAERLVRNLEHEGDVFDSAYNDSMTQSIRDTLTIIRGHFKVIVFSADLYINVANEHIIPCLSKVNTLPISASTQEQEQAKIDLERFTNQSTEAIGALARLQFDKYDTKIQQRVQEIDDELKFLPAPPVSNMITSAIKAGVDEAMQQTFEANQEKLDDLQELTDDF